MPNLDLDFENWDVQDRLRRGNNILFRYSAGVDLSDISERTAYIKYTVQDLDKYLSMRALYPLAKFWSAKACRNKLAMAQSIARTWAMSVHPVIRPSHNRTIVLRECPAKNYGVPFTF